MKIIFLLLLLVQSFCCGSNTFQDMDKVYLIDDLLRFEYRAMTDYQILGKEDFETIEAYYDFLFNLEIINETLDKSEEVSFLFFIKTIKIALIQNKIPRKYIPKLTKIAIALNGFKNSQGHYLNTLGLIWYLEYRSMTDTNKANAFLIKAFDKNSSDSHDKIFKLLNVDSNYQLIENWKDKEKINNYSQLIILLKRQAQINEAFNSKTLNSVTLLIDDYKLTINQVFSEVKTNGTNYGVLELLFKHNDWLFLQMHKYKENPKINIFLEKIYNDWLIFNSDYLVKDLPTQNAMGSRYTIFKWINKELDIYRKIKEIRKQTLMLPRYQLNRHERAINEKNNVFVRQKLNLFYDNFEIEDQR